MMMSTYLHVRSTRRSSCAIRLYKYLKLVSVVLLHVLSISSTRLMIACSLWNKFFVIIIITAPFWDASSRASPAYCLLLINEHIVPVNKR